MLSIVIITRNREKELERAIESCVSLYTNNYEIIVVDNNSIDQTKKLCYTLSGKYKFNLNYLFQNTNLGVAEARNVGFKEAKGDIVYFLDDDAFINDSQNLWDIYEFMIDNESIGAIATEIYNIPTNDWLFCAFPKNKNNRDEGDTLSFYGGSHFINKKLIQGKLYPNSIKYGSEEMYLSILIWNQGYRVYYTKRLVAYHMPSKINRLSKKEIDNNNYINQFLVKMLILPKLLLPLSSILFVFRVIMHSKFNFNNYVFIFKNFRERFDSIDINRISWHTCIKLIRIYGLFRIL